MSKKLVKATKYIPNSSTSSISHLHLDGLAAIDLLTGTLADNLGGVNQVLKQSIVDSSKSTRSGTRLLGVLTTSRLGEDTALSDKDDVTVRELLLQLAGQSI